MKHPSNLVSRLPRHAVAALSLAFSAAAAAQTQEVHRAAVAAEPLSAGSLLQVTLGLAAVVITIFALAWFARRYGRFQASAGGALRVVGGLSVGPRERVVLLQVHDRQLVLGVAPGRVQTLHVLEGVQAPPAENRREPAVKAGTFAALLSRRAS